MVFTYDKISENRCQAAEFCFHDSTIQMHNFEIRLHCVTLWNDDLTTWSGTAGSTQKPDFRRETIVFDGFRCVFLQITCHWHATCRLYAFGYLRTRGSKNRYLPWYNKSCTRGTSGRCPRRHGTTFPIRLACRENVFSMVYTVCACLTWLSWRLLWLANEVMQDGVNVSFYSFF